MRLLAAQLRQLLEQLGLPGVRRGNAVAAAVTATTTPAMFLCILHAQDVLGLDPAAAGLLRPIYDELAALAVHHQARYWLQDIRHRDSNDPDITRWLLATYFPDVAARLGGRLHVAYLVSPALLSAVIASPGFVPPEAYRDSPYMIASFSAEGDAYSWLAQEQLREAGPAATA